MLDGFPQGDFVLWVFMCVGTNVSLFCDHLYCTGYHAEGYHAPSLPPRAITPVYTSRLPHQSYHAPPIHVHRVITPAISYSYFVVLSFAGFYATCASPPTPPPGATRHNLLNSQFLDIRKRVQPPFALRVTLFQSVFTALSTIC